MKSSPNIFKKCFGGLFAALLGLLSISSANAQILNNGDFATGDFTGWTVQHAYPGSDLYVQPGSIPPTGAYPGTSDAVVFGTSGTVFDYISQSFASTPGTTYQLSFALETYGNPNEFLANIGGTLNLTSSGSTLGGAPNYITGGTTNDINNTSTDSWSVFTQTYTATSISTSVIFGGVNNNETGVDYLTAVSVNVVPEPSTWALLLGGLGLLAFWRARARRTQI